MLNPNKIFWYIAPTYTQAKEIIWRDPEMLNQYLPKEIVSKKNDSELVITLINGSVIGIKGADKPDSLRGPNPFGVILDEYEMMHPEVWTEILYPLTITNPKMFVWFIGTPTPQGEHFRQLHERAMTREGWYALTLSVEDSGILTPEEIGNARAEAPTAAAFEQEFMCQWLGENASVFRGVDACIYGEYREPTTPGKYQWGLDLAKHVDWTVLCGIDRRTHRLEVFDRYNQIDWNLQKARIEATVRRHGMGWMNTDMTGVGDPIVEDLISRGLSVTGIQFTESVKKNLVVNLAHGIEQRLISIPNIPELIQELKIFAYEVTSTRRIKYGAPNGYHDDCVMALALAWWDIGTKIGNIGSPIASLLNKKEAKHVGRDLE